MERFCVISAANTKPRSNLVPVYNLIAMSGVRSFTVRSNAR